MDKKKIILGITLAIASSSAFAASSSRDSTFSVLHETKDAAGRVQFSEDAGTLTNQITYQMAQVSAAQEDNTLKISDVQAMLQKAIDDAKAQLTTSVGQVAQAASANTTQLSSVNNLAQTAYNSANSAYSLANLANATANSACQKGRAVLTDNYFYVTSSDSTGWGTGEYLCK